MRLCVLVDTLMELLAKGSVTAGYLAQKYGISERSVYRYLKELSTALPISIKRGRQGGIYLSDCFTLPRGYMLEQEYETAIEALDEAYGKSGEERFLTARRKLSSQLKKEIYRRSLTGMADNVFIDDGGWEATPVGSGVLGLVAECVRTHEVLEIEYADGDEPPEQTAEATAETTPSLGEHNPSAAPAVPPIRLRIEPHALIVKRDLRYVYAFCRTKKAFRLFRLSGILTAVKTNEVFFRRPFRLDKIPFSVSVPEQNFINVRLQISPAALPEAKERLGEKNVRLWKNEWLADLTLPDNELTVKRILELGNGIKVLSPKRLQERVKLAAEAIASQYVAGT